MKYVNSVKYKPVSVCGGGAEQGEKIYNVFSYSAFYVLIVPFFTIIQVVKDTSV